MSHAKGIYFEYSISKWRLIFIINADRITTLKEFNFKEDASKIFNR